MYDNWEWEENWYNQKMFLAPFSKCTLHYKMSSSNSLAQKKLSFYSTSWVYALVKIHKGSVAVKCKKNYILKCKYFLV